MSRYNGTHAWLDIYFSKRIMCICSNCHIEDRRKATAALPAIAAQRARSHTPHIHAVHDRTDWFFTIFCSHLPIFSLHILLLHLRRRRCFIYLDSCFTLGRRSAFRSVFFFGFCFFAFELWQLLHWLCYGIFVQSRKMIICTQFACGMKTNQSMAIDGIERAFESKSERAGVEFQGRRIGRRSHIGIYWNWTLKKCLKSNSVHVLLRIVIIGRHLVMFIN